MLDKVAVKDDDASSSERRLRESKRRLKLLVRVAVATVASLTRFLFSHPICLADMPIAFSLTGKFTMPVSPPAALALDRFADSRGGVLGVEELQERKGGSRRGGQVGRRYSHDSDYWLARLAVHSTFAEQRAAPVTSR